MMIVSSTNQFTELTNHVYMVLTTIKTVGAHDINIGELGERGKMLLEYLEQRMKREVQ